jgi:hypothetical protein
MCLTPHQQLLAARTSAQWPHERLLELVSSSSVPVQYLSSIFDFWRKRAAKERATRAAPIRPQPIGLSVAEYSLRHSLNQWHVYAMIRSGALVAVKTGGAMRVHARR